MNKKYRAIVFRFAAVLLAVWLLFPVLPLGAQASSTSSASSFDDQETVGFGVRAILPQNQRNTHNTYFDLRMKPSATQMLEVSITNFDSAPLYVTVEVANGETNDAGLIVYEPARMAGLLKHLPFKDLALPMEPYIAIAAGQSKTAHVAIAMPAEEYDGCILGGIAITKYPSAAALPVLNEQADLLEDFLASLPKDAATASAPAAQEGVNIYNKISYAIAVVLSENDTAIAPDFESGQAEAQTVDYRTAVVIPLHNTKPVIVKQLQADVTVYKKVDGAKELFLQSSSLLDFAPESAMNLPLFLEENTFPPGDYSAAVHLEKDGQTWDFESDFTVTQGEANKLESSALIKPQEVVERLPGWVVPVFVLVGVLLVGSIFIGILLYRKRR